MPDTSGSVDLGSLSAETRERLTQMAEEHKVAPKPDEPQQVHTAFTVVVNEGQVSVIQYEGSALFIDHNPTGDEVYSAAAVVQKDLAAQETAQHTAGILQQHAMQMQQQIQAQQIRDNLGPNLRG